MSSPTGPRGDSNARPAHRYGARIARRGLQHVDIVVSSLERSLPLYRELLRPLGYTDVSPAIRGERGEDIYYLDGEGVGASLGLCEAQSADGEYDRYRVGLHHLAFEADSRERVDERLAWARAQGLEIEDEPREWPYLPGYYAGFFYDPDGIKLEVVFVP